MFELLKLAWDFVVLRNQAKKGQLKPVALAAGGIYAVLLYAIGLPATLLYVNHPGNRVDKAIFIAAVVVLAALTVGIIVLGLHWRRQFRKPPTQIADEGERTA
jgi:tryptophan-rich sensory protein